MAASSDLHVVRGTCTALFAFDVGSTVDLEVARKVAGDAIEPAQIAHHRHAPEFFRFDDPPLRVVQRGPPIVVGGRPTTGVVDVVLYDFGAVSVSYDVPLDGSLQGLEDLACALSQDPTLLEDARARTAALLERARTAVREPNMAPISEDYVLWRVESFREPLAPDDLVARHAEDLARLLGGSRATPSREEVQDLVENRLSFERDDVTLVDWNAAFVLGTNMDDVCAVLEFANVQLLETRFLDARLDRWLDRAYEALYERPRGLRAVLGATGPDLARVGQMQVDGAILFERLHNALKLLGDQALARVHRAAARRFHLEEWNAAILRKTDTIESIYEKLHDNATARRMEALEWLIILLIAVSLVLPFLL